MVTAGPTYEAIDPVRFIGNHSSGKMGFAIAETLADQGAQVHLIAGPTALHTTHTGISVKYVSSAEEMYNSCMDVFPKSDIVVLAAAVADYKPAVKAAQKIKKKDDPIALELIKTHDIAASLGKKKDIKFIVGFALETNENQMPTNPVEEFDFIVLNSLNDEGAGWFRHQQNSIIDKEKREQDFELKSKKELHLEIVNKIGSP